MSSRKRAGPGYSDLQRQEAASWFVAIHADDDPTPASLQAWMQWMDQDEGNRIAFEEIAQAWHATPAATSLDLPSAEDLAADGYSGDQPVEAWLAAQAAAPAVAARGSRRRRPPGEIRGRSRAWRSVASLVAIGLVLYLMSQYLVAPAPQPHEFATRTGEQIAITLADGSRVWLGPKSRLVEQFTAGQRVVQLASGEAFFSVRKDRTRPFSVRSGSGDITAVGTAFNVRALADHVTVAVSEGIVTVVPLAVTAGRNARTVRVASGQQASFTAGEALEAVAVTQSPMLGERARWREGVLVYRDEPLRDVVADVVRYADRPIEIADAAVGDMHFSGVVYRSAVAEWTRALPESFPVVIVAEGDRDVIRSR